jgi:hypothetical protein
MIFSSQSNRTDRALDGVGVQFDAAIMQEARQTVPTRERVADRFGKRAVAWYKRKLRFKPDAQSIDDWLRTAVASRELVLRRLTANVDLDGIELANPAQRLYRDPRIGALRHPARPASCVPPMRRARRRPC